MGRWGWSRKAALLCALLVAGCGGTGGGPSDSGKQFVFQARGQLYLLPSVAVQDPTVLTLLATLLDPQGNPFRNTRITLAAEFRDATFIPEGRCVDAGGNPIECSNLAAVLTDDKGQAQVKLVAGLTTGPMRIIAEAPPSLNILTSISVTITNQGFVTLGSLGIIPSAVTFVNPLVGPTGHGPMTSFNAVGGTPPYRWDNSNKNLGTITPRGLLNIDEKADYTLTGPIPTDQAGVLQDTVTLLDAAAAQATATVTVVFAECQLIISPQGPVTIDRARGGEQVQFRITNGVGPFTITQSIPDSGTISPVDSQGIFTFTAATPPVGPGPGTGSPDTLLIRDSRGCVATVNITIIPATGTIVMTANPSTITFAAGVRAPQTSLITAAIFDKNNNPVRGVLVRFSTTAGTLSPLTATTDANGVATTTLTIPPGASDVTVTALAPGGASGEVIVTVINLTS